jgi:hypothetical protein
MCGNGLKHLIFWNGGSISLAQVAISLVSTNQALVFLEKPHIALLSNKLLFYGPEC